MRLPIVALFLHRVLQQLLSDAYWGDLDLLLIDLPPGTGDLAISLGQLVPASEIIVVTTPQIAAAEVAERAGRIAHQIKQHVIGVIENMSDFACPTCGGSISLFGTGGGEATAQRLSELVGSDVPLLGKIPFRSAVAYRWRCWNSCCSSRSRITCINCNLCDSRTINCAQ